jgi:small nuclear ribonucleoprotein (snRNP)-like protein
LLCFDVLLLQLFYSFFKTLIGKQVAVELKNDVALVGTLHSVDQYLNIKLLNVSVVDGEKFPQLVRSPACLLVFLPGELSFSATVLTVDEHEARLLAWQCDPVRADPGRRSRHGAASGRRKTRGQGQQAVVEEGTQPFDDHPHHK